MKKRIDRRQFGRQVGLGALAASAALVGGRPRPAHAAPTRIRMGWVVVPASSAPLVLEKKELLTNFGKSYVAEAVHFEGTPPVITALAAGELEIGPLAFSSFALAIENAHMDDLRVICDEVQDGVPGHGSNEFMVLKEGPVKTVADLKGKVIATNVFGSAVDIAMRGMLKRSGLEANRDYTIIEAPFPAMRAILAEKKADLISAVPPFSLDPNLRSIANTLFTQKDAFGITQLTMWTARTPSLSRTAPRWLIFLPTSWAQSGGTPIRKITMKPSPSWRGSTRRRWRAWNGRSGRVTNIRDPNGRPNLAALQSNLQLQKQVGLLNEDIDVKKYADLSMVEEAAKRLG